MAIPLLQKYSPLRIFCQTVLPAVYDDSLSYYEVLCKVVARLNEDTEVWNTLWRESTSIRKRSTS